MPLYDIARFRALKIPQDLGNAEHPHGQHGKIDSVREIIESQRETLLAGLEILTDRREQQPEYDHDAALSTDPRANTIASPRPSTIRPKYSAGPKRSASLVSGAPMAAMTRVATVPAQNDAMAAMPSAMPAWPFFAIACPSSVVTTDVASPGMLTRIAVVEPPYWAP